MEVYQALEKFGPGYEVKGLSISRVVEDMKGLKIDMVDSDGVQYQLSFRQTYCVLIGTESTRLKTLRLLESCYVGLVNKVTNSKLLEWFNEESNNIYSDRKPVHYSIITADDFIDVISMSEPCLKRCYKARWNFASSVGVVMKLDAIKLDHLLDSDNRPDPKALKSCGWDTQVIFGCMGYAEADWIATASRAVSNLYAVSYSPSKLVSVASIKNDRDSILQSLFDYGENHVCLVDQDIRFLVFVEQNHRFFLISGESEFIARAYPISLETNQLIFAEWVECDVNNDAERRFLNRIWGKYT